MKRYTCKKYVSILISLGLVVASMPQPGRGNTFLSPPSIRDFNTLEKTGQKADEKINISSFFGEVIEKKKEVLRLAGFDRDFVFEKIISWGDEENMKDVLKFIYVGKDRFLPNGVHLEMGEYYVVKATFRPLFVDDVLVPQANELVSINPKNEHSSLPKLVGLVEADSINQTTTEGIHKYYGDAIVMEFVDGKELQNYFYNLKFPDILPQDKEDTVLNLTLRILKNYKEVYADKGYVYGDISPSGIIVVEDDEKIKRIVFVDNDSPAKISDTSEIAIKRKSFYKEDYTSEDRKKRIDNDSTPAIEVCLPRDDIYSLCAVLLFCISLMLQKGSGINKRTGKKIYQLKRLLKKYKNLSKRKYSIRSCKIDCLIEEVEALNKRPAPKSTHLKRILDIRLSGLRDDFNNIKLKLKVNKNEALLKKSH